MSRKYKFNDSRKPYFVSFAIINWIDLFTRKDYVDIVSESLLYCIQKKGLILNAMVYYDQSRTSDNPIRAEYIVRYHEGSEEVYFS